MYVWGLGVLAAGEGTTMTGCYAGQLAMEVSYSTKYKTLSHDSFFTVKKAQFL